MLRILLLVVIDMLGNDFFSSYTIERLLENTAID